MTNRITGSAESDTLISSAGFSSCSITQGRCNAIGNNGNTSATVSFETPDTNKGDLLGSQLFRATVARSAASGTLGFAHIEVFEGGTKIATSATFSFEEITGGASDTTTIQFFWDASLLTDKNPATTDVRMKVVGEKQNNPNSSVDMEPRNFRWVNVGFSDYVLTTLDTNPSLAPPAFDGAITHLQPIDVTQDQVEIQHTNALDPSNADNMSSSLVRVDIVTTTGIPSQEALGAFDITNYDFAPLGIPSQEVVPTQTVTFFQSITFTGIPSLGALGAYDVLNVNELEVPRILSNEIIGNPQVVKDPILFAPASIDAGVFGNRPQVYAQNFIDHDVIVTAEAVGSPQLDLTVSVNGIPSEEAQGLPALSPGTVDIAITAGIVSQEEFGSLVLTHLVDAQSITSQANVEAPVLTVGAVSIAPVPIVSEEGQSTPGIKAGTEVLDPDPIGTGESVPEPGILSTNTIVSVSIGTGQVVATPVVVKGAVNLQLTTGISSEEEVPTQYIVNGKAIRVEGITGQGLVSQPEVSQVQPGGRREEEDFIQQVIQGKLKRDKARRDKALGLDKEESQVLETVAVAKPAAQSLQPDTVHTGLEDEEDILLLLLE